MAAPNACAVCGRATWFACEMCVAQYVVPYTYYCRDADCQRRDWQRHYGAKHRASAAPLSLDSLNEDALLEVVARVADRDHDESFEATDTLASVSRRLFRAVAEMYRRRYIDRIGPVRLAPIRGADADDAATLMIWRYRYQEAISELSGLAGIEPYGISSSEPRAEPIVKRFWQRMFQYGADRFYQRRGLQSRADLHSLRELSVVHYGDAIRELPAAVGHLTRLTSLSVYSNRLTALPDELTRITALRWLFAFGNELHALPATTGALVALEHLDVSYNRLTTLPASLPRCSRLTTLQLVGNPLVTLPDVLFECTALTSLSLGSAVLTGAFDGAAFARLTRLERLDVSLTQWTRVPDAIGDAVTLRVLSLESNALLAELPPSLAPAHAARAAAASWHRRWRRWFRRRARRSALAAARRWPPALH